MAVMPVGSACGGGIVDVLLQDGLAILTNGEDAQNGHQGGLLGLLDDRYGRSVRLAHSCLTAMRAGRRPRACKTQDRHEMIRILRAFLGCCALWFRFP